MQTLEPQMHEEGSPLALERWGKTNIHSSKNSDRPFIMVDAPKDGSVGTYW